jgi:hypothetical protein
MVMRDRILVSLLRTESVAEHLAKARVELTTAIRAVEDVQVFSFEECTRRILEDLSSKGLAVGSKEHLSSVERLPFENSVKTAFDDVLERNTSPETVTSLELLLALLRTEPALAAQLRLDQ